MTQPALRVSVASDPLLYTITPKGGNGVRIEVSGSAVEEMRGTTSECNSCHVSFTDRAEQVTHYRLDWHRYNLKRRLRGLPHVSQAKFEEEAGEL